MKQGRRKRIHLLRTLLGMHDVYDIYEARGFLDASAPVGSALALRLVSSFVA